MTLEAGTRVTPNVELVRPLGEGGMGSVWVARHEGLDTEVAVKFVSAELNNANAAERFKREAAMSAKIKSPHVVKTFDYGVTDDGLPYIVMELLDGESLGDRLARRGRLVPRDVALVVSQTAQVLTEAHELGVVHRDIKPDNIFLIEAGYDLFVKVLDFGIAKQTTGLGVPSVTDTGAIVGTPEYMAPEQLLSPKSADWRADMWALGVLAYRALIGVVPFSGETLPSLSMAICNARFRLPGDVAEGLPAGVDDWFVRALAPEPHERFVSVTEMAHALSDLLRNSVTELPRVSIAPLTSAPSLGRKQDDGEHGSDGVGKRDESGTLASAMSEAAPALFAAPEIAIEEAAVDPHATTAATDDDGPGLLEEERTESSRRRGPVVIEIERARSTNRPTTGERPVPSTMRFDEASEKRDGRLKLAGILLMGVLLLASADFLLRGPGEIPKPKLPPTAQAENDDLWADNTAVVAPVAPVTEPTSNPNPQPVEPTTPQPESAPPVAPTAMPVAVVPRPRPQPAASPTAKASASNPCATPYIVQADGSLKIKPGCAKR